MLITLVIIGVIAALTIPNLLQKYQEQTTVKKVQKFYSNLVNAYNLAIKENGTVSEWGLTGRDTQSAEKIYEFIYKPYFKIAKNCGVNNTGNCLTNNHLYKTLNNSNSGFTFLKDTGSYKLVLDDGSLVILYNIGKNVYSIYDVNGIKEPDKFGVDAFYFTNINDKMVPFGINSGINKVYDFDRYCRKNNTEAGSSSGFGCAAWIIYKGNMDYLHCDLTWDKNSCKDK